MYPACLNPYLLSIQGGLRKVLFNVVQNYNAGINSILNDFIYPL